jgi:HlyD family type I secretion membrane fusion protein
MSRLPAFHRRDASSLDLQPVQQRRALAAALARPAVRSIRLATLLSGGLFLSLAAWASLAPLKGGVTASGLLVADGDRQTVEHPSGGVIARIRVREGDVVEAGQVLIDLEDIQAHASARSLVGKIATLRAEAASLEAVLAGANMVVFSPDMEAARSRADIAAVLDAQRRAFDTQRAQAAGKQRQLDARLVELRAQIEADQARLVAQSRQIELAKGERDPLQPLLEQGLVTRPRVLSLERAIAESEGEFGALTAEIARMKAEMVRVQAQLDSIGIDARASAAERLRIVREELSGDFERSRVAEHELQLTSLKAPIAGRIVGLSVNTVGEVVAPGETLMEVVPSKADLVVLARIKPEFSDDVQVGTPATISFDALTTAGAPRLRGHVVQMSADAQTDTQTGEFFFEVRVAVSPEEVARLPDGVLTPGLPAMVLLEGGERTALQYLLAPIERAMFSAARES